MLCPQAPKPLTHMHAPFSLFLFRFVLAAAKYGSSYEYPFSPNKPAPSILVCTPSFLHKYTNMKAIPLFCKVTTSAESVYMYTPGRTKGDLGLYLEGTVHPSDPTDLWCVDRYDDVRPDGSKTYYI